DNVLLGWPLDAIERPGGRDGGRIAPTEYGNAHEAPGRDRIIDGQHGKLLVGLGKIEDVTILAGDSPEAVIVAGLDSDTLAKICRFGGEPYAAVPPVAPAAGQVQRDLYTRAPDGRPV